MIQFDPNEYDRKAVYKLLTGSVVPRPIAWVSSIDADEQPNLAPFSYFNIACSDPPMLLFCPQHRPDTTRKDTLHNVEQTGEFVIHIVSQELAHVMNQTSAEYPSGMNEFEQAAIRQVPSLRVKPPRVADAKIAFECRVEQITRVGGETGGAVVIGHVLLVHLADDVWDDGYIVLDALKPVGRLAGSGYARMTDTFDLARPEYKS